MARVERFLGHGQVTVSIHDPASQEISLHVVAPALVVHSVMPVLVRWGVVADVRLQVPVVAWAPAATDADVRPEALARFPGAASEITRALRSKIEETIRSAVEMMMLLDNPGAVLCMLPMGTYVELGFRATAVALASTVHDVATSGAAGAPEMAHAMAGCLAWVLERSEDVRTLPEGTPPAP